MSGPHDIRRRPKRAQAGSALVEVLVSVVLFSMGVIALLRVLGTAVTESGEVEYRAVAATIADSTIGRMWVDRGNLADYVVTDAVVDELPGGTQTVAVDGNVVSVTISWQPPGAANPRTHAVSATLAAN